jgi:uncharacterized membrane protein YGL010W
MVLLSKRGWEDWIAEYARSHRHPVNRLCHTVGIPLIVASLALLPLAIVVSRLWIVAAAFLVLGWAFQLVGHAYEGKPPEFLKDWRFLFVGLRWWLAKVRGTDVRSPRASARRSPGA